VLGAVFLEAILDVMVAGSVVVAVILVFIVEVRTVFWESVAAAVVGVVSTVKVRASIDTATGTTWIISFSSATWFNAEAANFPFFSTTIFVTPTLSLDNSQLLHAL